MDRARVAAGGQNQQDQPQDPPNPNVAGDADPAPPQVQAVVLGAGQLQQLLGRVGGGRKLNSLASVEGVEWKTWRVHFETVAGINQWQDARMKNELRASMAGDAARLVADIPIGNDLRTIDEMLDDYEARFLPAAAGNISRLEFHQSRQLTGETIIAFHGRLRDLFQRAYPDQAHLANHSQLLRQTFALGLADLEVSRYVLDQNPADYAAALNAAHTKFATEAALGLRRKGGGINQIGPDVNQINRPNQGPLVCWSCGKAGHFERDCYQRKAAPNQAKKQTPAQRTPTQAQAAAARPMTTGPQTAKMTAGGAPQKAKDGRRAPWRRRLNNKKGVNQIEGPNAEAEAEAGQEEEEEVTLN